MFYIQLLLKSLCYLLHAGKTIERQKVHMIIFFQSHCCKMADLCLSCDLRRREQRTDTLYDYLLQVFSFVLKKTLKHSSKWFKKAMTLSIHLNVRV